MSERAQLFIGRLNKDTRVKDLEAIFAPYGRMIRCDIKYGVGTAYAFIDYDDRRDAEDAIRYENGRTLLGNRIVCEFAKGKSYRASGNSKPAGVDECYKCHRSGHWARDCPDYKDDRYGRGGGDYGRGGGRVKRSYTRSRSRSKRRSEKDKKRERSRDRDRERDRYKRDSRSRSRRKRSRSDSSIPVKKRSPSRSRSRDRSPSISKSKSPEQSRSRSKSYRSENNRHEGSNEYKDNNGKEDHIEDRKSHTSRSKSLSRSRSRSYSKSDKDEGENRYQDEEMNE